MPPGKKSLKFRGGQPSAQGPAHWQEDFRSMLGSVLNRLLGRSSTREDTVFAIHLAEDEAVLTIKPLEPPRSVTISIDEHLASWTGEQSLGDRVMPDIAELLVLLEADFQLPSASSTDRKLQQLSPEDKRAAEAERAERRMSVQGSLRKSIEKRLSRLMLEELVSDGVLELNPDGTNVANAFTLGPNFVAPPPQSAILGLPEGGSNAQFVNMLAAALGDTGQKRGSTTAAAHALAKQPRYGQPRLPQAQPQWPPLLAAGGSRKPQSLSAPKGSLHFVPPGGMRLGTQSPAAQWAAQRNPAQKRPAQHGRRFTEQPQQLAAQERLERWCEERGAGLEGGIIMEGGSWTATFSMPACQLTGGETLTSTGVARSRADAREAAAASLLEQAELMSSVCLPPPNPKRARLTTRQS